MIIVFMNNKYLCMIVTCLYEMIRIAYVLNTWLVQCYSDKEVINEKYSEKLQNELALFASSEFCVSKISPTGKLDGELNLTLNV